MDKFIGGCIFVIGVVLLTFALHIVGTLVAIWAMFQTYAAFGSVLGEVTIQQVIGVFWPLSMGYSTLRGFKRLSVAEWQLSSGSKSDYKVAVMWEAVNYAFAEIISAFVWVWLLLPLVIDLVNRIW